MADHITDFLPTEAEHFKARYNPWLGGITVAAGVINLTLRIWLTLLTGGFSGHLIVGILLTVIGVLYFTRHYFSVAPNRITLYNLLGSAVKRYTFVSFEDLSIRNNKIFIADKADARETKANITKWLMHPKDWEALQKMIESQK